MDDEAVEVPVQIEYIALFSAPSFANLQKSFIELSELATELGSFCSGQSCNPTTCDTFEAPDDEIEFIRVLFRQRGNDHARFADVAVFENISFALQPVDGAANRSSTHIEPFGEVRL